MKKAILTSAAVLLIGITAFSQQGTFNKRWYVIQDTPVPAVYKEMRFDVRGRYSRSVKKETLSEARLITDFIPGYPTSWITDYLSVVILTTCNGKAMKATGVNEVLNTEQKTILKTADVAADVVVEVTHKFRNPANDRIELRTTHASLTVIPDIEAQYVGGYEQMIKYLKENVMNKIAETSNKEFQQGTVIFTVNEQGNTVNAKIFRTSGDAETDKLLLDAIRKMPKWKPAENLIGIKVKQEFEFTVNDGMSGC